MGLYYKPNYSNSLKQIFKVWVLSVRISLMFEIKKHHLINFLIIIWLSHFIQILVPETGFDAVWYHLPVVDGILKNGSIIFSPEFYQSLNPLFSDMFFLVGYYFSGETGTKVIAYFFATGLIFATYKLSRIFFNFKLSLGIIILVSTFQVISWQSSSFYVDVAKAFWEILAIYFLIKSIKSNNISDSFRSVFSFSASLATKLFSIFLLPAYLYIFIKSSEKIFSKFQNLISRLILVSVLLFPLIIPAYFYLNSYSITGNPFYSFSVHLQKLSEIGGQDNFIKYIFDRTVLLLFSPFKLIIARDYVSPLISILLIPVVFKIKEIFRNKRLLILFVFSISQWLIWWYLPPLSTRYAISGFISMLILEISVLKTFNSKLTNNKILILLALFAFINFIPRIFVNIRSLKYLLGNQTQKEYIEQFYDGSIDQKLKDWYKY